MGLVRGRGLGDLLNDQFQQTLTLLLFPAWLVSEFSWRVNPYTGSEVYVARLLIVLGAFALAAFLHRRERVVFGVLFAVGALLLPIAVGILTEGWRAPYGPNHWGFVPLAHRAATIALIVIVAAVSLLLERRSAVPVAMAAVLGYALPWAQSRLTEDGFNGVPYTITGPNLLAHALVAAAAMGLVGWGVFIASKALVNYGVAAFAVSVMWFYFSSVMGKLDRSLGLIGLGVLFLAGGWALERTRRRLVAGMPGYAAEGGAA